eukprot:213604-Chlamydomonas_euryale.AAC.7
MKSHHATPSVSVLTSQCEYGQQQHACTHACMDNRMQEPATAASRCNMPRCGSMSQMHNPVWRVSRGSGR